MTVSLHRPRSTFHMALCASIDMKYWSRRNLRTVRTLNTGQVCFRLGGAQPKFDIHDVMLLCRREMAWHRCTAVKIRVSKCIIHTCASPPPCDIQCHAHKSISFGRRLGALTRNMRTHAERSFSAALQRRIAFCVTFDRTRSVALQMSEIKHSYRSG